MLQFQDIRKPELLERLLQSLALQIGSEVSYNELATTLRVGKETIAHYVELLEKSFVIFRLAPFSRNLRTELTKMRKIYFYYLDSLNTVSFHNCILWSPGGDNLDIFMNKNNILEFHYSDLLTTYLNQRWPIVGYPYQNNQVIWGSGNMAVEPRFVHTDSLAYLLPSGSVLVDAGNPDPRHNDSEDMRNPGMALWPARGRVRNDMGAYGGQSVSFVVPVELTAFTATIRSQDIILHWQTLSESINYGFVVQRCMAGQSFRKIAFLPGMGTTAAPHRYEYTDTDLEAGTYN